MAWNYTNTENIMKYMLQKKLINDDEAVYITSSLEKEYSNVPAEVSMHFEDLYWINEKFGVCGLLGEVVKLNKFDEYTAKKMAEVRAICKKVLIEIKGCKAFDKEYSVWEEA